MVNTKEVLCDHSLLNMVAHGRLVTSSCQITEVKQCRARLVLGWMTSAQVRWWLYVEVLGKPHISYSSVHPVVMGTWWIKKTKL